MANKIAKIDVLENLIKNKYHRVGGHKIEIGHFWSVLQIYLCMQKLGVSVTTICKAASMLQDRLDSKYRVDEADINPSMMRKYLALKSSPSQISHTVVTKLVSKGASADTALAIKDILIENNSYGPEILNSIMDAIESGKGRLTKSKFSVMGSSGFAQVLKLCLVLTELFKSGIIDDMSAHPNADHLDIIIKTIKENQKNVNDIECLGFELGSL